MKIYINNVEIKAEILPSNTPTLDETLETFSFALVSNTNPLPYTPMQSVKVDFLGDGTELAYFYIVNDSVETYSLNPIRYKHSISCIQNTRKLSKHLVRNSVFSQPANIEKRSFNSLMAVYSYATNVKNYVLALDPDGSGLYNVLNQISTPLILESREKIKKLRFKISLKTFVRDATDSNNITNTWNENIKTQSEFYVDSSLTKTFFSSLRIKYTDSSNNTHYDVLNPSDLGLTEFQFNQEFECSKIQNIFANGGNNVEIQFFDLPIKVPNATTGILKQTLDYIMTLEVIAETYYYSAYDVLNLLIERQKKQTSLNSLTPLFSLPTNGDLYDLLTNTIAPNFTFTQLTMYECVAEVFRLFDAIFTMDENGELGIEYFNDLSQDTITPTLTGRNLTHNEDKYTNGLISNYQDGRVDTVFPGKDNFIYSRSSNFGVASADDHQIIVDLPIHHIKKVETTYALEGRYYTSTAFSDVVLITPDNSITIDITFYIVMTELWNTLPLTAQSSTSASNTLYQMNSLNYTPGDNAIQLTYSTKIGPVSPTRYSYNGMMMSAIARLEGLLQNYAITLTGTPDWKFIKMRVEYQATVDGKTKIHSLTNKYDGETIVDQSNGAVDLNKLGLNILGLSLKLGNPTLNATHKITSWANRIKTGQLYQYQGGLWIANVVNYTFMNGYVQGKVSFVQNFNQLALRTQLLREKRMSNISSNLVQKSEEIITDFVYYYGSTIPVQQYQGEVIHFNKTYLLPLLHASFKENNTNYDIQFAAIHTSSLALYPGIYIPMVRYGAGNTINFEMSYDSPISAGNKTKSETGWFGTSDYYTTAVKYTDDYGFLDSVNVETPVIPATPISREFPNLSLTTLNAPYFKITNYRVYKQPNEIFALNYQLAFLPVDETKDFLGSQFINDNAFVHTHEQNKKCYICFKAEKSSILDGKATPYFLKKEINSITSTESNNAFTLTLTYSSITNAQIEQTVSWAIVDENDNILFASNSKPNYLAVFLHFFTKLNRLS